MSARQLSANEYKALKAMCRQLVIDCGGPNHAALVTRISQQQISRCISPAKEFSIQFLSGDVIADLEAECGEPTVTRWLAEQAGYVLIKVPSAKASNDARELVAKVSEMLAEVSDVSGGVAKALADDHISPKERDDLHVQAQEAIAALVALNEQIKLNAESDDDAEK